MPKLPLDPARLRQLPDLAIKAFRRPRHTAAQVVTGTLTVAGTVRSAAGSVVGGLLDRRPAAEPVPGATTTDPQPPPTDVDVTQPFPAPEAGAATEAAAGAEAGAVAAGGATTSTEPSGNTAPETAPEPLEAPSDAAADADADAEAETEADDRLTGPAPHMPPSIAQEVERDFGEDLPGVSGERGR